MLVLSGPRFRIDRLVFSPDGDSLVAPWPAQGVYRWAVSAGAAPEALPDSKDVHVVHFTPDGKWMLFSGRRVILHNVRTGTNTEVRFPPPRADWGAASLSPDGKQFVTLVGDYLAKPPMRLVCRSVSDPASDVWSVDVLRLVHSPALFLPGGERFVAVEWWNGKTGFEHGPAFVTRDVSSGKALSEVREQNNGYSMAVQSPDLGHVAARYENRIAVFRTEDFQAPPVVIKNTSRKDFTGVAFHPSGRWLAATSNDETVKLYDTATWQLAKTFTWQVGRLRSVAFSPDGTRAAVGSDTGKIVVWDVDL